MNSCASQLPQFEPAKASGQKLELHLHLMVGSETASEPFMLTKAHGTGDASNQIAWKVSPHLPGGPGFLAHRTLQSPSGCPLRGQTLQVSMRLNLLAQSHSYMCQSMP